MDTILEFSTNQQTKYYALQILEQVIQTRWRALPRNQCDGIRKYIVGLIIKISSVPENLEREKVYLRKLNFILVQVRGGDRGVEAGADRVLVGLFLGVPPHPFIYSPLPARKEAMDTSHGLEIIGYIPGGKVIPVLFVLLTCALEGTLKAAEEI